MAIEFDLNRVLVYFGYGLIYALFIGALNKRIEELRTRSSWWNHWIVLLEIERKSIHVLSWFCIFVMHDLMPIADDTNTIALYFGFCVVIFSILNIIRLCSPTVKSWVRNNWKGFLRDEEKERWPAIFSLLAAITLSNLTTGLRVIVILGCTCCTTGDAFACFMGRAFPNSREIRNGKTWAGFLGAGILTSIHNWLYLALSGYIVSDLWTSLVVLFWGFLIGGVADLLPSKEIGLDDNFTTITIGSHAWLALYKMSPHLFVNLV